MAHPKKPFEYKQLDETIEQLSHIQDAAQLMETPASRLVDDLQRAHRAEIERDARSLASVYTRLQAYKHGQQESTRTSRRILLSPAYDRADKGLRFMHKQKTSEQSGGSPLDRRISLFAAILVAVVLIGALGVALALSRLPHQAQVAVRNTRTATSIPSATPTPPSVGTVVHTQENPAGTHVYLLAWSPDGTRIASLADDPSGTKAQLLIWNALNGSHLQTFPFATTFNEIHWSPTGKYLALANLKYIMIVDSLTGSVVKTFDSGIYVPPPPTSVGTPATGTQPLSSLFPQGGGYGFFSVAWTPDGSMLAVAISQLTSSKIELLNPLTGAVKATLFSAYGGEGGLGFSSDGHYLAASNDEQVTVWQVASRSIVFQKNPGQSTSIAWQPGTHKLSVLLLYPGSLQLWDIDTQKVVKTYPGVGVFAWSSNGKEIAVHAPSPRRDPFQTPTPAPTSDKVVILDAASGASVATYTSQEPPIVAFAWSPDGRYIATVESHSVSTNTGSPIYTLIRIWVA